MTPPEFQNVSRRVLLGTAAAVASVSVPGAAAAASGSQSGDIEAEVRLIEEELIAFRRDLNANPEGPGEERRTAGKVAEALRAAGLEVRTGVGGHGVVGVLRGRHRGRTVAYRADMDAVPAQDQIGGGTAAKHLCGHDIHTTVGVGVARVLAKLRRRLHGTVVFVFQPAEESLTGARAMLDDGVFARTRPEEIHALHCGFMPVGVFGVNPGSGMPGLDRGSVTLAGADAVERAEALAGEVNALGTVSAPQTGADLEQLIADLQVEDGPLASFVFMRASAEEGMVRFSSRCWPEDRYPEVRADVDRLAQGYGSTAVYPEDPFPAMPCPEAEANALKRFLRRNGHEVAVIHAALPFSGEDFGLFMDDRPGTYAYLGVQAPGADVTTAFPHFPGFTPDEAAIGHGVRGMAAWLSERSGC
ncbi:amidohydrolase [Glycomyces sambucus]|uniref:Amidohydrolase n=1 Tax=Glycomyces sambucus TaxID=380244 RepID=A0A1G9JEM8_9ACTN|nr:M20/M25/M40 family metallo-hydrolase [Glycomyces sambucus]SDL35574.1 amidohydrolase [Glycomyces sambucus]